MPEESRRTDAQKTLGLATDFLGEDRHEFIAKLAYELWTKRGRPLGSPDVDWFAAEQAVYASLVASNSVAPSPRALQHVGKLFLAGADR